MKKLLYTFCFLAIITSCKQKQTSETIKTELSTAQKIANAHGFENWKNVSEIKFTFNKKRNWIWQPKTDDVTLTTEKDTIHYNRKSIDSLSRKADRRFINDKFWLLIPFQLVWDTGTTISDPIKDIAPISKIEMNKITLLYSSEGGYTPGDAYDIYFEDDYIIKELAFRRGNKPKAGLTNTFENYQDFNGIKIAKNHQRKKGDWNLTLTNISVKK